MKMSPVTVWAILPLLAALNTGCMQSTPPQVGPAAGADTSGLQRAVAIAVPAIHEQSHYPQDGYTLTSAQQIIVKDRYIWRITFKPTKMIPKDPSSGPMGAGGEIFVNVDPITQKPEIGYGE